MACPEEQKVKFVAVLDSDAQWVFSAVLPDGSQRPATPAESAAEESRRQQASATVPIPQVIAFASQPATQGVPEANE